MTEHGVDLPTDLLLAVSVDGQTGLFIPEEIRDAKHDLQRSRIVQGSPCVECELPIAVLPRLRMVAMMPLLVASDPTNVVEHVEQIWSKKAMGQKNHLVTEKFYSGNRVIFI